MELNGTWYAVDTIKKVSKVHSRLTNHKYFYHVFIVLGNTISEEIIDLHSEHEAEQSRKELIKQLEK